MFSNISLLSLCQPACDTIPVGTWSQKNSLPRFILLVGTKNKQKNTGLIFTSDYRNVSVSQFQNVQLIIYLFLRQL